MKNTLIEISLREEKLVSQNDYSSISIIFTSAVSVANSKSHVGNTLSAQVHVSVQTVELDRKPSSTIPFRQNGQPGHLQPFGASWDVWAGFPPPGSNNHCASRINPIIWKWQADHLDFLGQHYFLWKLQEQQIIEWVVVIISSVDFLVKWMLEQKNYQSLDGDFWVTLKTMVGFNYYLWSIFSS